MARPYLKRKLITYRCLYQLNREFTSITRLLWELQFAGFLHFEKMDALREYVWELQSEISHEICSVMHRTEEQDWFHYGQYRIFREHYLNPDRPAFFKGRKPEEPKPEPPKEEQ